MIKNNHWTKCEDREEKSLAEGLKGAGHVDIGFYLFPEHLEWLVKFLIFSSLVGENLIDLSLLRVLCKAGRNGGHGEMKVTRDANSLKHFSGATGGHLCKRRLTGEAATALRSFKLTLSHNLALTAISSTHDLRSTAEHKSIFIQVEKLCMLSICLGLLKGGVERGEGGST